MERIRHYSKGELTALSELVEMLGLSKELASQDFVLTGEDPIICSPHQLGYVASTMLGLVGMLANMIWGKRSSFANNKIKLSIIDALHNLHDEHFIHQQGYLMNLGVESVAVNGYYPCKDGRAIHIVAGPPYMKLLNGYLNFFDCGNNRESIAKACMKWESYALEEALSKAGLPAVVARTYNEWKQHPVGNVLDKKPLIEIEKLDDSGPVPYTKSPEFPVSGVKVLDFTHVLAGPLSTETMALFGADVLHITSPYHRDTMVQSLAGNFGKKCAYLNLDVDDEKMKMQELLKQADIFVNSYRPGVPDKYGIGLKDAVPLTKKGIIYLDVRCYGFDNIWTNRPGFESIGQACSGFGINEADGDVAHPKFSPVSYLCDPLTGYAACAGMLAALHKRATEGGSYHVKVSLAKTGMWVIDQGLIDSEKYKCKQLKDTYPFKLTSHPTVVGDIEKLAFPLQCTNLPMVEKLSFFPFGYNIPEFSSN